MQGLQLRTISNNKQPSRDGFMKTFKAVFVLGAAFALAPIGATFAQQAYGNALNLEIGTQVHRRG